MDNVNVRKGYDNIRINYKRIKEKVFSPDITPRMKWERTKKEQYKS